MPVGLRTWLTKPVTRGVNLLSYLGIIVALLYGGSVGAYTDRELAREAQVREEQICGVIINVHDNAKFRFRTEQHRVEATVDYLSDTSVPRDALYKRIAANLPAIRTDRDVARNNVEGTTPPAICNRYKRG